MKYKDNENKRGFTLIELIAVLVILAIIALIATPLVMNIVKKAKDSANRRSVDAYGKAVELAIATHLLDNGDYPTDLNSLTVEYTGNEVVCNVKTLNEDGSVYLSECSVKDVEVKDSNTNDGWYHYGKLILPEVTYQSYAIGDVVTYNEMDFYVIENSDETSDRVTMLKAEPLSVDEVNTYGVGHVNMHVHSSLDSYQTANDINGYGGMQYYSSSTCGQDTGSWVYEGCTTDYGDSEVKYVVDAWVKDKIESNDLIEDSFGYSSRLITFKELIENLDYEKSTYNPLYPSEIGTETPNFIYNRNYEYWTMDSDGSYYIGIIGPSGSMYSRPVNCSDGIGRQVRPVITLKKSAI